MPKRSKRSDENVEREAKKLKKFHQSLKANPKGAVPKIGDLIAIRFKIASVTNLARKKEALPSMLQATGGTIERDPTDAVNVSRNFKVFFNRI